MRPIETQAWGEAVDEIRRTVCADAESVCAASYLRAIVYEDVPMGSTQKVGPSVKGSREPAAYDSSPMLHNASDCKDDHQYFEIRQHGFIQLIQAGKSIIVAGSYALERSLPQIRPRSRPMETAQIVYAQVEAHIFPAQLSSDELLHLDIVLRDEVDGVLLLVHVTGREDRLRPGEDQVARLARKGGREFEYFLEIARV